MLIAAAQTLPPTARSSAGHEFAYPHVRQIATRAHAVLVSSLTAHSTDAAPSRHHERDGGIGAAPLA